MLEKLNIDLEYRYDNIIAKKICNSLLNLDLLTSLSISCRASSAATRVEAILSSLGVASTVRVLRFESSKTHLVEVLESHVMSWARRGPRASQQPR